MSNESPIIQSLQAIHEQVQQSVRAELGDEWHITSISQQSRTKYMLAPNSMTQGEWVQTEIYANYRVECQDDLWRQKRMSLVTFLRILFAVLKIKFCCIMAVWRQKRRIFSHKISLLALTTFCTAKTGANDVFCTSKKIYVRKMVPPLKPLQCHTRKFMREKEVRLLICLIATTACKGF
jgi:hypothetical protein